MYALTYCIGVFLSDLGRAFKYGVGSTWKHCFLQNRNGIVAVSVVPCFILIKVKPQFLVFWAVLGLRCCMGFSLVAEARGAL